LKHWALEPGRPGRNKEVHLFPCTQSEAENTANRMIRQGLIVHFAAIPRQRIAHSVNSDSSRELFWLVANNGGNEITRILEGLRDITTDHGLRIGAKKLSNIQVVRTGETSDNEQVLKSDSLALLTRECIGQAVSLHELAAACHIDRPGFHLQKLALKPHNDGGLSISGVINNDTGKEIGRFSRHLPKPPKPGELWIAKGNGFYIPDKNNQRREIGRRMTQRFLAFLYHLGVDALELKAGGAGAYVWPRMGFDFADEDTRDQMIRDFRQYLSDREIFLSPDKETELDAIRHSWELADFQRKDGRSVGEAFLVHYGTKRKDKDSSYRVRFWLRPDYPGWIKLLKGLYPPAWDKLSDATRSELLNYFFNHNDVYSILMSDKKHAEHILERINNWFHPVHHYLLTVMKEELDDFPEDSITSIRNEVHYLCEILRWMMEEYSHRTELGRFFWELNQSNLPMMKRIFPKHTPKNGIVFPTRHDAHS
jgi:hypothetical protein